MVFGGEVEYWIKGYRTNLILCFSSKPRPRQRYQPLHRPFFLDPVLPNPLLPLLPPRAQNLLPPLLSLIFLPLFLSFPFLEPVQAAFFFPSAEEFGIGHVDEGGVGFGGREGVVGGAEIGFFLEVARAGAGVGAGEEGVEEFFLVGAVFFAGVAVEEEGVVGGLGGEFCTGFSG